MLNRFYLRRTVVVLLAAGCDPAAGDGGAPGQPCSEAIQGRPPVRDAFLAEGSVGVEACLDGGIHRTTESNCPEPGICVSASECKANQACVCAFEFPLDEGGGPRVEENTCVPSNCNADVDCGGFRCDVSLTPCVSEVVGQFCHTGEDECAGESDCPSAWCVYSEAEGRFVCVADDCMD